MQSETNGDTPRHVLVTGGAGYIGSHACKVLRATGYIPVTVDNLSTGWAQAVKYGPFEQVDLTNRAALDAVFIKYAPIAVMHFAAFSLVGEAMSDPGKYWRNNVIGSLTLILSDVRKEVLRRDFQLHGVRFRSFQRYRFRLLNRNGFL